MSRYHKLSRQAGLGQWMIEKGLGAAFGEDTAAGFLKNMREMKLRQLLKEEIRETQAAAWKVWGKTHKIISPEEAASLADVSLVDMVVSSLNYGLEQKRQGLLSDVSWPEPEKTPEELAELAKANREYEKKLEELDERLYGPAD